MRSAGSVSRAGDGGLLGERGRAHEGVLLERVHFLDDVFGSGGIAHAPAGHGGHLREAVEDNDVIEHAGHGGGRAVVVELLVDVVGNDEQIVPFGDVGEGLQLRL